LKSLYGRRVGLRCVPDWPITSKNELLARSPEPKAVAHIGEFPLGYASLLACAWGKPSDAFGPGYASFDGTRRCPRLPGPPFHFISRVTARGGAFGEAKAGIRTELEYDIPKDAWYFDADGNDSMPFAVLLEAALQPCGWTAAYRGLPLTCDDDLYFRNLEGTATQHAEVGPDDGTLRTEVRFTNLAKLGTTVIEAFDVQCFVGDRLVYTMNTRFGHFPKSALAEQAGLPSDDTQRARLTETSDFSVDLKSEPERYCAGDLRLPKPTLLMFDRVSGYWPTRGKAGLGILRAEKDIDPGEWFFKAHFFQDPVQPGSLGIEAMIQLLRFYAIERGLGAGMKRPRFEPLAVGRATSWKYRGQVRPWNKRVVVDLEITDVTPEASGTVCVGNASLWVDGTRIYEALGLTLRVVERA
jgi:3-hydroxymyristoyl/3-hydroxydecanoyl-(acyl carrier protein) dehydratase